MPYTAAQKRAYAKKMAAARARKAAPRRAITGRGAYRKAAPVKAVASRPGPFASGFATRMGRALATAALSLVPAGIGFIAGGPIGAKIGAMAGSALGAFGSSLVPDMKAYGRGDYVVSGGDVNQNSLVGRPPQMVNKWHKGETVISNQEYLGDIITSPTPGAFRLSSYSINPGWSNTFPLVAQIAANYEEYRVEGLLFEFRSMSADALNSVNTALGSVILATNYNAGSPLFTNKAEMENYEGGVSCKPSKSVIHFVECARMQSVLDELYVRTGAISANQDIRFSDLGTFQIATTGFQGSSVNIGELWVSYQFGLLKLKMFVSLGNFNGYFHQQRASYTATTALLGSGAVTGSNNNMQISTGTINGSGALATYTNGLYFPDSSIIRSYRVNLSWVGSTAGVITFPSYVAVGCITFAGKQAPTGSPSVLYELPGTAPSGGDTAFSVTCCLNVTTLGQAGINTFGSTSGGNLAGAYLAFQNSTTVLPTVPTGMDIMVTQIPNLLGQNGGDW